MIPSSRRTALASVEHACVWSTSHGHACSTAPERRDATMADTIRTGIVGATVTQGGSGWGANAHVPALHLLPDYALQAVCTAHEDTAQASKEKFDAVHAFHDIDAMAQHPEIDLVVVCVRVPGHKDLVMAGLHANKAVFCEWPLGATLAEAQEMATCAKARGLKTIVGLQARSDPTLMYARDLLHEGYIGEVLTANLRVISQQALELGPGRLQPWPERVRRCQRERPAGRDAGPGPVHPRPRGHAARPAAQRGPGLQARGTRLRFGHGIRGGLRSRGDAPQADRRDRALGR